MDTFLPKKRSEIMSLVKSKNTGPEIVVRKMLHKLGYRFRLHNKKLPGNPDIVLKKYKTVILVNGCFWHHHKNCKRSKLPENNKTYWQNKIEKTLERDSKNQKKLREMGWNVIIIWECQMKNLDDIIELLKLQC